MDRKHTYDGDRCSQKCLLCHFLSLNYLSYADVLIGKHSIDSVRPLEAGRLSAVMVNDGKWRSMTLRKSASDMNIP